MKKILVLLLSFILYADLSAQFLTNKEGVSILPQRGNWCIGIDATRFIKDFSFNFISSAQTLTGKYMKDSVTAYRFGLRLGFNSLSTKNMVIDRLTALSATVYPAAMPMKENTWTKTSIVAGLSFGIEKRRGNARLQGIYGLEGGIYISSVQDNFTYGNKLNASSLTPVDVDEKADAMSNNVYGQANNIDTTQKVQNMIGRNSRILQRSEGIAFSIGARAFIGAEYFFAPKISLGGEFGYGAGLTATGRSETTLESKGTSNSTTTVKQTIIDGSNSTHIRLDTDNMNLLGGASATLRLNLYF